MNSSGLKMRMSATESMLKVIPNSSDGNLQIFIPELPEDAEIILTNMEGKRIEIKPNTVKSKGQFVQINDLSIGIFVLSIFGDGLLMDSTKIIIQ